MSESEPSANEEKLKLEVEKLRKELEKLTVEIPKLRRESGWRATVMPSVVSVAAVCVTAVVSLASVFNTQRAQISDQEKSDRDLALNCVTTASVVANVVLDRSEKFDALPPDGKINFANVVLAAYPPTVADRFLRSLAPRLAPSDAASRNAFSLAIAQAEDAAAKEKVFPCPAVTDLIPVNIAAPEFTSPPPSLVASTPTSPTSTPAPTPNSTSPAPVEAPVSPTLVTYYQVTQQADRSAAAAVGKAVATASAGGPGVSFPAAGVEVVSAATVRQIEIRFYHREQEDEAKQLLAYVKDATHQQNGRLVFIGGTFPNLPQGRIEVWLPPLPPKSWGGSFCYQEQDPKKPAAQRYLVLCQPSADECEKIRGPNANITQTACVPVDLASVDWKPSIGMGNARYQFSSTPFGSPFPHL